MSVSYTTLEHPLKARDFVSPCFPHQFERMCGLTLSPSLEPALRGFSALKAKGVSSASLGGMPGCLGTTSIGLQIRRFTELSCFQSLSEAESTCFLEALFRANHRVTRAHTWLERETAAELGDRTHSLSKNRAQTFSGLRAYCSTECTCYAIWDNSLATRPWPNSKQKRS